jgi:hypothetical protein
MPTTQSEACLVPAPEVVRAELARLVRETRRTRALLRISLQSEEDRRFIASLPTRRPAASAEEAPR